MRILEIAHAHIIMEGGNVFKDTKGDILTTRIPKQEIPATLHALEQIVGIPLAPHVLGSVGKKESSGDIDVAVDPQVISKDELINRLQAWVKRTQPESDDPWIKKSGISVHFRMPIANNPFKGFVQVDFMFTTGGADSMDWMKFSMYSAGDASKYSGADRNMLLSSLAKAQGMKYSWQKGLIRRDDEGLISKDPDQIAKKLLGTGFDHTALLSVETIQSALDQRPDLRDHMIQLANALKQEHTPDGAPIKPGQLRQNQEEAARILKYLG